MSAQSLVPKKTSALLSKLRDSYSSGKFSVARSQAVPEPVVVPVITQVVAPVATSQVVAQESAQVVQDDDFALDTADAIIENLHSRRPTDVVEVAAQAPMVSTEPQVEPQLPAQAFPTAVDQAYQEQQAQITAAQEAQAAQSGTVSRKESAAGAGSVALDTLAETGQTSAANATEMGANIQYVEQERNPELPVEVEGFLQHVDDNFDQAPEEIVMANLEQPEPLPSKVPKQSVIVLPITPDQEKEAARKGTKFSVKWLVEWSRKIMKIFEGSVVYRTTESEK